MTKQNVEVNVNMVNVEGVSGVNNHEKLNSNDFTTLRILKSDLDLIRLICSVKGKPSTYGHKMVREMIDTFVEHGLSKEQKIGYDLILKLKNMND